MNESLAKYYLQSNCTNVSLVYIQGWSLFECTSPLSFQIMLVFLFWILVYLFGYGLLIAYSYHLHFILMLRIIKATPGMPSYPK